MGKRDWRKEAEQVEVDLMFNTWYRSPLWDKDHLLGEDPTWEADGLSWCGRALTYARDWDSEELGGLWYTNRRSASCPQCKKRQTEWESRGSF